MEKDENAFLFPTLSNTKYQGDLPTSMYRKLPCPILQY